MRIRDILKGTTVGGIQGNGLMWVIELIQDPSLQDASVVSPLNLKVNTTGGYGTISFTNVSKQTAIAISHAAYMTKQSAQDHALSDAKIVRGSGSLTAKNAFCIQQRQGGSMRDPVEGLSVLPFALREQATKLRSARQGDFGRLWPFISKFNQEAGINRGEGHLIYFFEKFGEELEQFVAQFEPIENQVGAIIILNGTVFGVEKAPNAKFFSDVFEPLIRTCYGTAAIRIAAGIDARKTAEYQNYPHIDSNVKDIEQLRAAYAAAKAKELEVAREVVGNLLDDEFQASADETAPGEAMVMYTLENEQLIGQTMTKESHPVYASMVVKQSWLKSNRAWAKAKTFEL